jgi:hypothetical protein
MVVDMSVGIDDLHQQILSFCRSPRGSATLLNA